MTDIILPSAHTIANIAGPLTEYKKDVEPAFQLPASPNSANKGQGAMEMELTESYGGKTKEKDTEEWLEKSRGSKGIESSLKSNKSKILARNESASVCSDIKAKRTHTNFKDKAVYQHFTRCFFNFDWFLEPLSKYCLGTSCVRNNRSTLYS